MFERRHYDLIFLVLMIVPRTQRCTENRGDEANFSKSSAGRECQIQIESVGA
jgi:hypothetical protein